MTGIKNRQLAAVMFADIVGYTAMMQADEHTAIAARKRYKQTLDRLIGQHQGDILQYYGDGSLSIFSSAVQAVDCAIDIQEAMREEPRIPLRIGIHTGDIIRDEEGVYGDGVNVASRIENLSAPGGILTSEKVYDEIKNHPQFSVTPIGSFELKNVAKPVSLYAISNDGLIVPGKDQLKARGLAPAKKSIAVLPFSNMSSDKENEYFSEGITEEIINVLVKIDGLDVTARTSAFAFKDKNIDIRDIGKQLGVENILEGSVRKAGNRVRITAQLIDTADGYHLFSESYDRDLEDIFAVQDEIALLIANKLRENFESPPKQGLRETPPTKNLAAYDLYLKGRHHMQQESYEETKKAISHFEKAIQLEPGFALPYTGLAFSYLLFGTFHYENPKESAAKAQTYAEKALELDENLAEANLALSQVYYWNHWDLDATEKYIHKALHLSPGSAEIRGLYSFLLLTKGNIDDALLEAKLALKLDPLSHTPKMALGTVYYSIEKYDEAIELFDEVLEITPTSIYAIALKAKSLKGAGRIDEAVELQKTINHPHADKLAVKVGARAFLYHHNDRMDDVRDCLDQLKAMEKQGNAEFLSFSFAMVHMVLNEPDKMFDYLEKCFNEKSMPMLFIKVDPLFKPYHGHPRFIKLMGTIFSPNKSRK